MSALARWTSWDKSDWSECIDGSTALIEGRPFDQHGALRFRFRGRQTDDFALDVEFVAGAHRQHPAQIVDAKPDQRMRAEWPSLDGQLHCDAGRVPPRRRQTLEQRIARRRIIKMHGLRIEFCRKPFDVLLGHLEGPALEFHTEREIVKPFDHFMNPPACRTSATPGRPAVAWAAGRRRYCRHPFMGYSNFAVARSSGHTDLYSLP